MTTPAVDLSALLTRLAAARENLSESDAEAFESLLDATYSAEFEGIGEPVTIEIPPPDQIGNAPSS